MLCYEPAAAPAAVVATAACTVVSGLGTVLQAFLQLVKHGMLRGSAASLLP